MNISYDFRLRAAESGHGLETETDVEAGQWLSACTCGSWNSTDKIEASSDPAIPWARHVIQAVGKRVSGWRGIDTKDF